MRALLRGFYIAILIAVILVGVSWGSGFSGGGSFTGGTLVTAINWATGGSWSATVPEIKGPTDAKLFVTAGPATGATGGNSVSITGGSSVNGNAGAFEQTTGGSSGSGQSGAFIFTVGAAPSNSAGAFTFTGAAGGSGNGSSMNITLGNSTGGGGTGGAFNVVCGSSVDSTGPNSVLIGCPGGTNAGATHGGGVLEIRGGDGGYASGAAGAGKVTGGSANTNSSDEASGGVVIDMGSSRGNATESITFKGPPTSASGATANSSVTLYTIDNKGGFDATGIATASTPAASAASHGKLFYDSTLQKWQVSENTGAYLNLVSAAQNSVKATNVGNFSTSNNTLTALTWDTELYKRGSSTLHSTSSNTSRLVAPVAGLYHMNGTVMWAGTSALSYRVAYWRLNGTTQLDQVTAVPSATVDCACVLSDYYVFAANDYVELMVQQATGGGVTIYGGTANSFASLTLVSGQ